jgi:CMP-N-acetylneuraminic acid synthetase
MIAGLVIDLNTDPMLLSSTALGRPLAAYPLLAAKSCALVKKLFVVSANPEVRAIAAQHQAIVLPVPTELEKAPVGAAHGPLETQVLLASAQAIEREISAHAQKIELLTLFSFSSPAVSSEECRAAIAALEKSPEIDSAVHVRPAGRFHPANAFAMRGDRLARFWTPDPSQSYEEAFFPDGSLFVLRPAALQAAAPPLALSWLGRNILPTGQEWAPNPLVSREQIAAFESWFRAHGYPDLSPKLELQPKPLPQPSPSRK